MNNDSWLVPNQRGDWGGGSEHRNTTKKFGLYRNIATESRQIPQNFNHELKLDVMPKPLLCYA